MRISSLRKLNKLNLLPVKNKVLVAFLINQKIGGQLGFAPALFFSKSFDQNYEKAI